MRKMLYVKLDELSRVQIICPTCQSTLDLKIEDLELMSGLECPKCNAGKKHQYSDSHSDPLGDLAKSFKTLKKWEDTFQLVFPVEIKSED